MNHGLRTISLLGIGALLSWGWLRAPPALTRGPYLQSTSARSVTLVCRTDTSSAVTLRHGSQAGPPWDFETSSPADRLHVFELTGLRPETRYAYELASGGSVLAQDEFFRTAPPEQSRAPLRFLAWGDSGTGSVPQLEVAARMEEVLPVPDFALILGDLVYPSGEWENYDPRFFASYAELLGRTTIWPSLGNHDTSTENGAPYLDAFYLPTATGAPGQSSNTERYYSFDHGMAHFTCADSESSSSTPGGVMYAWLEGDLADARSRGKRWLIVFMHHPPYTRGTHDSDSESDLVHVRENLVPLFEAQGVDLVLGGHSHGYERSFLARADAVLQDDPDDYGKIGSPEGTLYLVSGCGGKTGSGPLDHPLMARSHGDVAGFSLIDVSWEELRGTFVESDGETTDLFTLRKASDGTPPRLAVLEARAADELLLVFDEPVEAGTGAAGAENPANYALQPARAVLDATLASDQRTVVLRTASLQPDRGYRLAVLGVADSAGNEGQPSGWFVWASGAPGAPRAVLSTEVHTANVPARIAFSGARSSAAQGPLSSLRWDFGDGSPVVTGTAIEHLYDRTGIFTVSLIATDGAGRESIDELRIRIHDQGAGPLAAFSVDDATIEPGESVAFDSAGALDPDGGGLFVSWDFGDPASGAANRSQEAEPDHAYASAGSYTVVLTVVDDEGSAATGSAVITVAGSPGPSGAVFPAVADAQVRSSNPGSNYGSDPALRVRAASPEYRSYLRFQVSGLTGSVDSARLRLYATDGSNDGGAPYAVGGGWTESGITWSNAPPIGGSPLAAPPSAVTGSWTEYDVTAHVAGDGSYSFALVSASGDSAYFSSREGAQPPELSITTSDPPPDVTPPLVEAREPAPGALSVSPGSEVTARFDEPVQGVGGSTFRLLAGTIPVAASVGYEPATRTARLDPVQDLLPATTYTAELTEGVADLAPEANALVPLSWSFTTAAASPATQTFPALADALVNSTSPGNYGSDPVLRVRAGTPEYRSYVRFQVSGLIGDVGAARLRLYATEGSNDGGEVFAVQEPWSEAGITWDNAPLLAGSPLAAAGAVSAGSWVEYDVTEIVAGDGNHAFALRSASTDSAQYSSREGSHPPELVITRADPPQDTTAPLVTTREPAAGATDVPDGGAVTAAFDEPVQGVGGSTFRLLAGTTPVAASVSYEPATRTARLDPAQDLLPATTYTAALTAGIADLAPHPNALVPLSWSFTTASASPATQTFQASADALVNSISPAGHYGSDPVLRLRASTPGTPEYRSYVSFQVSGLTGEVGSARLRLYATDGSNDGGQVFAVLDPWTEPEITWGNAPPLAGSPLAAAGAVSSGSWVEYDVTASVAGDGEHSFGLRSASTDGAILSSREGTHPPELVVTLAGPPPDTTAPLVTVRAPAPGATDVSRVASVTVAFDEPVQGVDAATFSLLLGSTPVAASVSYDPEAREAELDPALGLFPETTYTAVLGAGIADLAQEPNGLVPLSWTFTTAVPLSTTLVLPAQADAPVKSSSPNSNYGADPALRLRAGNPEHRIYVRFLVSGLPGSVSSARLRLYATDASNDGGTLYEVAGGWDEGGITWSNAPPVVGGPGATAGAVAADTWVEYDVTSHVAGDGEVSFALLTASTDSALFSSREGPHPPELVLEVAPGRKPRPSPEPSAPGSSLR